MTNEELRCELMKWRREIAKTENKKAFQVFGNLVLEDLVLKKPNTLENLSKVRGVGPIVLSRYGLAVLGIIRKITLTGPTTTASEDLEAWWKTQVYGGFLDVGTDENALIALIVKERPTTKEELAEIPGMNSGMVWRYGERILKCLNG